MNDKKNAKTPAYPKVAVIAGGMVLTARVQFYFPDFGERS
jgi:hypothetical protein